MRPRAWYAALAFGFLAFAAYGSLVPLRLRWLPPRTALTEFLHTAEYVPLASASRTDALANFLLFLPIGVFVTATLADRSRPAALVALPVTVALSVASSTLIEFSQVFSAGRTPSWNDVLAESLGGTAGALAWVVAGPRVSDWFAATLVSRSPYDRLTRVMIAYAVVWFTLSMLPFDFTLRVPELLSKYRAGRIVLMPGTGHQPLGARLEDAGATAIRALPVGALCGLLARRRGLSDRSAILGGAAAIAAVELLQLFAVSRTTNVNDIISGTVGVALGVTAVGHWRPGSRTGVGTTRPSRVRLWVLVAFAAWCGVLVLRHWSPFDFRVTGGMYRARIGMLTRVPFASYYWASPLAALAEASTKLLLALPLGAMLQLAWRPRSRDARLLHAAASVVIAAVLFGVIEAGQLFLPTRVPDGTDILLGVMGAMAGFAVTWFVTRR